MADEQLVGSAHDDAIGEFIESLEHEDMPRLIRLWADYNKTMQTWRDWCGIIEMEIRRRMDADGATVVYDPTHDVEMKGGYDDTRLHPLLESEHVTYEELVEAGAFIPKHEKTTLIPDRWNATKLKPFGKRHREIQAIIDGAKGRKNRRLSIKPKETNQ
tara:strand:+ start:334 stop:810 length:477 start_codon:yes stop_codon:yes gene_type:complete